MRPSALRDRREILAMLGAMGAVAAVSTSARAQGGKAAGRTVDVHHHYFAPAMLEAQVAARAEGLSPDVRAWTPARSLDSLDGSGIATAILSTSSNLELRKSLDTEKFRSLARVTNEFAARMASDHAGRFGFFTFVPLPDVDGSLAEIVYGLDTLKADGVGLMTSYAERWLGDEAFVPVLAELNRRKANVFVHPLAAPCCGGLMPGVPNNVLEYPYDTGRAVVSLLVNGRLAAFRDIRWIFCHSGGPLVMMAGRIENTLRKHKDRASFAPNGIAQELKRLHFDTANAAHGPTMKALLDFVPPSQVLFGSDFPYVSVAENVENLGRLGLSPADLASIQHDTAASLFPRVKLG